MSAAPAAARPYGGAAGRHPEPERPHRVLHVINALGTGGAERQLVTLVSGLNRKRFLPEVAVLERGGAHEGELRAAGIAVRSFPRRGRFSLGFFPALVRHARRFDLVHAWLTPGVFFGLAAAGLARVPVAVGSERGSSYAHPSRLHAVLLRLEGELLKRASGVIANSRAGAAFARTRGVEAERLEVVYNGLAPSWPPSPASRATTRRRLGIGEGELVMLMGASFRPKKDHATLLAAVARLARDGAPPRVLLAGDGPLRSALVDRVATLGLGEVVSFLGNRTDLADLISASDMAVLSSKEREGCSNFLMEAMSLGVPVVTTDAGGSAEIVRDGETGIVVSAEDPAALARALGRLLSDPAERERLAGAARAYAADAFDPRRMIDDTEALYERWIGNRAGAGGRTSS